MADGRALPAAEQEPDVEEFVSCGAPLIGHEIRIVDPAGRELPERIEGRLQFRGPSATRGYYNNPEKTSELYSGDWLESGDLGYIAEGEVFVTGRSKDLVKRAGRNIHPQDVEAAVAALPGVEPAGAVLFGAPDPERGAERLVLVVETRLADEEARRVLVEQIQEAASDHLEAAPDDVMLVPPESIPRTESGKVKRLAIRAAYAEGRVTGALPSPRAQVRRLQRTALMGRWRAWRREAAARLYAAYWWSVIVAFGLVLWPLVLVLPGLERRWAMMHRASRLVLKVLGHRLAVTAEAPPVGHDVVYVPNHSSYIDSIVVSAVTPGPLAFAVFGELRGKPMEGPFLRRLGALFVERFEPKGAVADADRAAAIAGSGRPLVVFPEATIMRMPGLLDFRLGAFRAAAQAGVPVVPIAIRGTRSILRHDHRWFPRRGDIQVTIGRPIAPTGDSFDAAVALRDKARQWILAQVHEPDIAGETPKF
jgi:1-acyl-sn-glycerol-3-phosphate acyltransferase